MAGGPGSASQSVLIELKVSVDGNRLSQVALPDMCLFWGWLIC